MNGRCETDPFDQAIDVCDSCYGEFCEACLVTTKGRKYPVCKDCTLIASGVRPGATPVPRGSKKTARKRRKELRSVPRGKPTFEYFDSAASDESDADGMAGDEPIPGPSLRPEPHPVAPAPPVPLAASAPVEEPATPPADDPEPAAEERLTGMAALAALAERRARHQRQPAPSPARSAQPPAPVGPPPAPTPQPRAPTAPVPAAAAPRAGQSASPLPRRRSRPADRA